MSRLPSLNQLRSQVFRPALQLGNSTLLHRPILPVSNDGALIGIRNATKKAAGSKTSNKDSRGRRLGSKKSDGQTVKVGDIIYRQRGTKIYPGDNVGIGKDHTLFALEPGFVRFYLDPFHPNRKFAGVVLNKEDRLPAPHFAPTSRRFGKEELVIPKYANKEKDAMSRKEYLAQPKIAEVKQQREQKRSEILAKLGEELESFVPGLEAEKKSIVVERLLTIKGFLSGGRSNEEAHKLADRQFKIDNEIDVRANRITAEEGAAKLEAYTQLAAQVDAVVAFDPKLTLVKYLSPAELDTLAKERIEAIKALASQITNGINIETYTQIESLIDSPCFPLSTRATLRKMYIRKYQSKNPERPTNKDGKPLKNTELLTLVDKKKGFVVKKWNYSKERVDLIYTSKA